MQITMFMIVLRYSVQGRRVTLQYLVVLQYLAVPLASVPGGVLAAGVFPRMHALLMLLYFQTLVDLGIQAMTLTTGIAMKTASQTSVVHSDFLVVLAWAPSL